MLRPLGGRIVVRPDETEEVTAAGIYLPAMDKRPERGTVIAVGPGEWNNEHQTRTPISLEVGQRVLVQKYAGVEMKDGDDLLLVIHEKDVLGILE